MDYDTFIEALKGLFEIDLKYYKRNQMERRICNLMKFEGFGDFGAYLPALHADRAMLEKLVNHLTINFSEFFRDPVQWDKLEREIIPELCAGTGHLKIWSAGCGAGEEAYTLAMILADLGVTATLIASDIDAKALEKACRGEYAEHAVKNVTGLRLKKYFDMNGKLYQMKDSLKKAISFQRQDLIRDVPPDDDFDLIVCRNVLIYFTDEAKSVLYQKVSGSLRTGGYLFAGSTEQLFSADKLRLSFAGGQFFYRKQESGAGK